MWHWDVWSLGHPRGWFFSILSHFTAEWQMETIEAKIPKNEDIGKIAEVVYDTT